MSDLEQKCVNTVRLLSADMIQKANSGHPGAPMGCAPMAHVLFSKVMNFTSEDPAWPNRDRFVLSNGHGCALLYSMLHLTGYPDCSMDELKNFRQKGSKTPGHPENHITRGVEVSTGPLGQGLSNAVGLAIGEEKARSEFGSDVIDHFTYVICGDGCLMEGVTAEAASLAGHLGLGKLIVLWDDNHISIDGETSLAFSEDVLARFESYGWHTSTVASGDSDCAAIEAAVEGAKKETNRPSIIAVKTTIGFGSAKQDTQKVHGSPLGAEDLAAVKSKFGFDPEQSFVVSDDVREVYSAASARGAAKRAAWQAAFEDFAKGSPEKGADFMRRHRGELPAGWEKALEGKFDDPANKDATRKSGGFALNALAGPLTELIGGSADLNPSTLTYLKESTDFSTSDRAGRNVRFGVREHAMAAICNGLSAYGLFLPFCSTFLVFVGYAYGAVRVSALSHSRVLYIMTHDSIGLGEDGPTHQPVEVLSLLRATPNMLVLRPADARETAGAYAAAVANKSGPSTISLSRQSAPAIEGTSAEKVSRGAYTVSEGTDVILVGTGTEVGLCAKAAKELEGKISAKVVSFPSFELFDAQDEEYKRSVFTPGVPVLAVEAASEALWRKYAHATISMHSFGMSAPGAVTFETFGFTVDNVVAKAKGLVAHFDGKPAPQTYIAL